MLRIAFVSSAGLEFFAALLKVGYDGCVTIESFDPEMESIAKLCCIWRKLAESPRLLASQGLDFLRKVESTTKP